MQINYKVSDRSIDTCCNSRAVTKKARGCAAGVRSGDWRAVKADGEENAAVLERLRVSVSRPRNTWALLIETRLAAVAATCPLVSKMATQNDANKKPAKPHILTVSRPLRLEDDFY
ncbi:hypothetical protein SFRURICE_007616, partial [Spodoptera frugiperda]